MSEHTVLVEERDRVLVITINRPQARNALNVAVANGIADAVDELDRRDDLAVGVLTGCGGVFSAGMDLKAFLAGEEPMVAGRGLCGITEAPPQKPFIAAVEGWALAGGFELVLACDLVIAAESARFGVPEVKRALVAAAGGAIVLPRRVPRAVAMEMLLTGDPIDAPRAAQIGLVNRIVADGTAADSAVELANRIAANGPLALAATKYLAQSTSDWTTEQAWANQAAVTRGILASSDAREGATAFAEKRDPVWSGR